jgi:homoserine O-succinyltransferase/O-acetyltransferase
MPIFVDNIGEGHHLFGNPGRARARPRDALVIGVVNNMPDGALVSTERQLFDLLLAAAPDAPIHLKFYALPTVRRSEWGCDHVERRYFGVDDLCDTTLDGLIVTGAEPQAKELKEEPYWSDFAQVINWAGAGTTSTIWSCLAVHATVLHLNDVDRRPLGEKCIGVFQQSRIKNHPILRGLPHTLPMPHSRWNEIPEEVLRNHGYEVLTRSEESGVDTFIKQHGRSLFVFLQGHPEYEPLSLLGEYRRDIGRFLRGESEDYPTMPRHYFSEPVRQLLSTFRDNALRDRRAELLARFPVAKASVGVENVWQKGAHQLYRNWLTLLRARKGKERKSLRPIQAHY